MWGRLTNGAEPTAVSRFWTRAQWSISSAEMLRIVDRHRSTEGVDERRHRPQPVENLQRRLGRADGQQQGELVPPIPGEEVGSPKLARPGICQLAQEPVAGLVAGGVVQPLEVVEVDDHE